MIRFSLTGTPVSGCHGSQFSAEEAKIKEVNNLPQVTQHATGKWLS